MFIRKDKVFLLVMMVMLMYCFGPSNAYALFDTEDPWLPEKGEAVPEIDTSVTFLSKYIWRGQNLGDKPVMQVAASISGDGLTLDVFGNYSLSRDKATDSGRYQELTELDYTASYEFNVGEALEKFDMESAGIMDPLSISTGYTFYTFPNLDFKESTSFSHETFLGVSYDILLQPFFTWYWDVDSGSGSYLQFGGSHTFEFGEGVSATIGTAFGYNHEQWTDQRGWSDALITGEVAIPVFNYFTITPSLGYSIILDRNTYNDAQTNEFYGGISLGFTY